MEQKTKKRQDAKQRYEDNKSKSFITVKMKWNTFCKNDGIRDGIIPIIYNCNKIIYNAYHLANIHFLKHLEEKIDLPNLNQSYFQKICASVSVMYDKKNQEPDDNYDIRTLNNEYKNYYPTDYKLPYKDYLGALMNNVAKEMSIASNNHILFNFGKRLLRYINLKYNIKNAWYLINDIFNENLYYVPNWYEVELKEWLIFSPKEEEIKKHLNHFIKLSYDILKFMEQQPPNTKGVKTFTILPNKSSFVNSYIKICSTSLKDILKILNKSEISNDKFMEQKDKVWRSLFNINAVETINRKFNYEISTDGYGVSIGLYKPKQIKDLEDENGKIKCECGCLIYKKIISNHKKTKEHKKYIKSGLIPNEIIKNTEKYIGIDPGVSYLFTGYDNENKYHICSTKDYRNKSMITKASKWRKRQIKDSFIEEIQKTIHTLKVSSKEKYLISLKQIQQHYDTLVEFYNKKKSFAKWKFTTFIYSKKALYKLCKDLCYTKDKDKNIIIGLGDWSQQQGIIKRHPTAPVKKFKDELRKIKNCYVIDINEYRTSKECSLCHNDVKNLNQYTLKINKETNFPEVILTKCHQVVRCTNNECSMCWQRDKNASRNIYKKLQDTIDSSTTLIRC
jgi:hypothetical protein